MSRIFIVIAALSLIGGCTTSEPGESGFSSLFDGESLSGWSGDTEGYAVVDGAIVCLESLGRNLYTAADYSDFVLRFEFNLTPGANNGIGIRAERGKDAAYFGMEVQVIDNLAEKWAELQPWQFHGSIYGIVAAERGHLLPAGQWNREEIRAEGNHVRVTLNGHVIVDADIEEASREGTLSGAEHPGLFNSAGAIGFLGHGDQVAYRNIRIKELE